MTKPWILILAGFFVILFFGCGGNGNGNGNGNGGQPDNPVPTLTSIDPASKVDHMPSFTLTVSGSQFFSGSRIVFNGVTETTNYVSGTELTCTIEPDDIRLTSFLTQNFNRFISVQDSTVPVLVRNPSPGGGDSNVMNFTVKSSYDFSTPIAIGNEKSHNFSSYNAIAVDDNNNVYAMWPDDKTQTDSMDMHITHSTDGGETWSPQYDLTDSGGDAWNPSLAVNPLGRVYAAWRDDSNGLPDIFISKSYDNGQTWPEGINVTNSNTSSYLPRMSIDSHGIIYLLCVEFNQILFSKSVDDGISWTPLSRLSSWGFVHSYPALCINSQGHLAAAWIKSSTDIQYSMSMDGGNSWTTPRTISQNVGNCHDVSLGLSDEGRVYAAWHHVDSLQSYDVFLTHSTNMGDTWSQTVNLSNSADNAYSTGIAVDAAGNAIIIWKKERSQGGIYFSRSVDSGSTWSSPALIFQGSSHFPVLAVDPTGNLHIVFWGTGDRTHYFRTNN